MLGRLPGCEAMGCDVQSGGGSSAGWLRLVGWPGLVSEGLGRRAVRRARDGIVVRLVTEGWGVACRSGWEESVGHVIRGVRTRDGMSSKRGGGQVCRWGPRRHVGGSGLDRVVSRYGWVLDRFVGWAVE